MKSIYLDFDRTIYNTDALYGDMNKVLLKYGIQLEEFELMTKYIFKEPVLFNYFKVVKSICLHKHISLDILDELEKIINNGNKYIYNDVVSFLNNSKKLGYRIIILTYGDRSFQLKKLSNLDICDIIDDIVITSEYKFNLFLDYKNSIFIDDNPRDLNGLYNRNARKIIRISRKNAKYSKLIINNNFIKSYNSLAKINIKKLSIIGDDKNE